ncbi:MAG TPA: Ku protein [Candidatus Saccharimonadales bacterium]|nr:Ku protein [Candidatus Saccharimonadales bacterium]
MRALWTGSLSFGLINIPVRLYSGSESRGGIELTMLHKKDLSPIRYARICRADGKEIPFDQIVKGYEYQEGDYVVLTDDDLKKANARRTKSIDIEEFVHEDEIDVRYYEKPYYLEPDKNAAKPYALLREALNKSGRVAIAKFVLRNKEHLAAVKPVGKVLVLEQMRFPSDLRAPSKLDIPEASAATKKEIDMALALIDQLSAPFIPEDFHDTYTEELEALIEAKAKGKKPKAAGPAPKATPSKDLMSMLKASLEKERDKAASK